MAYIQSVKVVVRALVLMSVICALTMGALTFPYHLAYAMRVSGWCDIYIRRNVDFSETGSPGMVDSCELVERELDVPNPTLF